MRLTPKEWQALREALGPEIGLGTHMSMFAGQTPGPDELARWLGWFEWPERIEIEEIREVDG